MPNSMDIILNGDSCWPDLTDKRREGKLVNLMGNGSGGKLSVAALPHGTVKGNTTVTIRLDTPDGTVILTEVTLKLWRSALEAFEAVYGSAY